jgi:hypothetical protein
MPIELSPTAHRLIEGITRCGVTVVESGGDGACPLDDVLQWTASTCVPAFDRTRCDSGALLVGAGRANDSARLPGSSFGTRVDLHAWGEEVTTLGYGDLVTKVPPPVPPELRYTGIFSGTSAATAIVAGGAASLAPSFPGSRRERSTQRFRRLARLDL